MESTATGHQRAESRINRTLYLKHRREKLKNQEERPAPSTSTSSSAKSSSKMQMSSSSPSTSAASSSSSALKADEPPKAKRLVMEGVRVYINGYLCDTTDIEMKRTVTLAGGQVLFVLLFYLLRLFLPNSISYTTQSNTIKRDAHLNITRPQRFQDPQALDQELKKQSAHRETRMGCRQHQRWKEVARTALHSGRQPHDEFCRKDVRRAAV